MSGEKLLFNMIESDDHSVVDWDCHTDLSGERPKEVMNIKVMDTEGLIPGPSSGTSADAAERLRKLLKWGYIASMDILPPEGWPRIHSITVEFEQREKHG